MKKSERLQKELRKMQSELNDGISDDVYEIKGAQRQLKKIKALQRKLKKMEA
jgi:hypothetical protein